MRHRAHTARKGAPAPAARLFARVGLWLAAFALLAQSFAFAVPTYAPRGASAAAAELSALLGGPVLVCVQDDPDSPAPPPHGCDQCPLCRLAAGELTLALPAAVELAAPIPVVAAKLALPQPPPLAALSPQLRPPPRGPPSPT